MKYYIVKYYWSKYAHDEAVGYGCFVMRFKETTSPQICYKRAEKKLSSWCSNYRTYYMTDFTRTA